MREILFVFLRIGLLGFGGPVATIAMMGEETCRKRKWIDSTRFIEMYSVCKLLPGPVATQMAIYLGYEKGGILGGLISGCFFILPDNNSVFSAYFWYYGTTRIIHPKKTLGDAFITNLYQRI